MTDEPSLHKTLREDFREFDFRRSLPRDWSEIKDYFLDEDERGRLRRMRWFKRWFFTVVWLLKSLFFKLTPSRRIFFFVAFVLLLANDDSKSGQNTGGLSAVIFLFILMLELKDKFLARDELETGRAVQRALMPEESPEVAGWSLWLYSQPANEVGGDLVDFLRIEADRFGAVLADISGKGLGAALFTAKLQAILRALAPDFDSVSALCEKINRIFYRDFTRSRFASMVYLEFRSGTGTIDLVNAGHLPPLILRGSHVEELPKGTAALGIIPDEPCNEQSVELLPDDILFICSDGLTEARNEQGEFYGEQRLHDVLSELSKFAFENAGQKLVEEVTRFRGEQKSYDDLSIILLKRL